MSRLHLPNMGMILFGLLCHQLALAQSIAWAHQQKKESRLMQTLPAESQKLKDVLTELSRQHQVSILFEETTVQGITVPADTRLRPNNLEKQLQTLLKPHGLTVKKISGQAYYVIKAPVKENRLSASVNSSETMSMPTPEGSVSAIQPLAATLPTITAIADIRVSGRVTGEKGEGLPGVNIVVKGAIRGTNTDADGRYQLSVPNGEAVLVFSFVGYASQEIPVGNRTTLDVQLLPDNKSLNEVVVVGYGTQSRRNLTSAISTIKPEELNRGAISDVGQLLQGKVPGLNISANGDPNAPAAVVLRGASTINSSQGPFYVIDGVPGADISIIAPDDIASIDVLKDAAATAIYGNRAANGVIMVTTKRGKKGQMQISYSGYVGIEKVSSKLNMMDATQLRDFLMKNGQSFSPTDDKGANTNWQDAVEKSSATSNNHNLLISGGTEHSTYSASINYLNKQGILQGSSLQRVIARLAVSNTRLTIK